MGRKLRCFNPNWNLRLFRKGRGRMEDLELHDLPGTGDNEIHEHVTVHGSTGYLRTPLRHDDYRGLTAWLDRHNRYATWEAHLYRKFRREPIGVGPIGFFRLDPFQRKRVLRRVWVRHADADAGSLPGLVRRSGRLQGRPAGVRLLRPDELLRVHHRGQAPRARRMKLEPLLNPGVSFEEEDGIAVFPVESEHARAAGRALRPRGRRVRDGAAARDDPAVRMADRGEVPPLARRARRDRARLHRARGLRRLGHGRRAPRTRGSLAVVSADISLGASRRARERARRHGLDLTPVVADAENLPFADRSFDLVYVHDGLHHLEHPEAGVAEMARVARHAVSITEPARAARHHGPPFAAGLALEREEAGNRVARLDPDELAAALTGARVRRRSRGALRDALPPPARGGVALPLQVARVSAHRRRASRGERRRRAGSATS